MEGRRTLGAVDDRRQGGSHIEEEKNDGRDDGWRPSVNQCLG